MMTKARKPKYPQCRKCADHHKPAEAECKRYNGYANYETWAVSLWIDNDQASYSYWHLAAHEAASEAETRRAYHGQSAGDAAVGMLARQLEEEIKEQQPDLGATMWSDLMGAALSEVDWYEIAGNLLA